MRFKNHISVPLNNFSWLGATPTQTQREAHLTKMLATMFGSYPWFCDGTSVSYNLGRSRYLFAPLYLVRLLSVLQEKLYKLYKLVAGAGLSPAISAGITAAAWT